MLLEWGVFDSSKQKGKDARKRHPGNILVPVDFSAISEKAFAQALSLAAKSSRIILLHVVSDRAGLGEDISSLIKTAKRSLLAFSRSSGVALDHSIQSLVRAGVPFQEILSAASESNVEMIVLGLHDSGPLAGVELGDTIERVSRYATCPVLLVRGSDAAKAPAASSASH